MVFKLYAHAEENNMDISDTGRKKIPSPYAAVEQNNNLNEKKNNTSATIMYNDFAT